MTNLVDPQRGSRQEGTDTLRIREFLRMTPPSFTSSRTSKDPENFTEALKKVFKVMNISDTKRVELDAYQLKVIRRTQFDQWNEGNESGQQKSNANWSSFQQKQKGPPPSSSSAPSAKNNGEYNNRYFTAKPIDSQGYMSEEGSNPYVCAKCGRNHSCHCRDGYAIYFKCDKNGNFRVTHLLYAFNNHQEQEDFLDVVTVMIQVFVFTIYALLDPRVSLSSVTLCAAMNFNIILEQLSEPFNVSTPVGEFILA
ncbi:uncharacterized protein [Solanum lycopersicum]|uniref:uncharacterized protein n=1 Tax=Solanum lycopersicum TaxID=4081 RepID=UPI003748B5A5